MSDTSDRDWKFGPSDFQDSDSSSDDSKDTNNSTEQLDMTQDSDNDSSVDNPLDVSYLALLPLSVAGLYTFLQEALVLGIIEGILGANAFSLAITKALWVIGAVSATAIVGFGGAIGIALLLAVVKRSLPLLVLSVLGAGLYAINTYIATTVFSTLPLLVGFSLASSLLIYGGMIVVGIIGVIAASAML